MLEEGAKVVGDVRAPRIAIAPGALLRGYVQTANAGASAGSGAGRSARATTPRAAAPSIDNLRDRLSRLSYTDACKVLGPSGGQLIARSANLWDLNPVEDLFISGDLFRLRPRSPCPCLPLGPAFPLQTPPALALRADRLPTQCIGPQMVS